MNPCLTAATAAAGMAVSGLAQASDDTLRYSLSDASAEALSLELNKESAIDLGVQVQFRYQGNIRDDASTTLANPDDDVSLGFVMRRLKLEGSADITDNLEGKFVLAVNRSDGTVFLEDTYGKFDLGDGLSMQIGQFKVPLIREEIISSKRQLAPERSPMNETFTQNRSQGIQLNIDRDNWRAKVALSDGIESDNTTFVDSDEADFAITGRAELKFGEATFRQFRQFTSWRGAEQGALLGGAFHYQTMGDTNPSAPATMDFFTATADFSWVDDGWNAYGAFVFRSSDDGMNTFDDFGALAQAGLFLTDQFEIYGRWDAVFADSERGATGNDYHHVSCGFNYYYIPESHAAKITFGIGVSLDPTTESIVSTSDGHNLLPDSEDGQVEFILQSHFLF